MSGSGSHLECSGMIFVSHASADDDFVKQLRETLESHHLSVWVDSRNLRGGSILNREVEQAIENARHVIVVLSLSTVNSRWVRREIETALNVAKRRKADGFRVIPLLLPGLAPSALENWFEEEPIAVPVQFGPGGLGEALPTILAALGERLPTDVQPPRQLDAKTLNELVLTLTDPRVETGGEGRHLTAIATLSYEPGEV
jgi:hypothetical protein